MTQAARSGLDSNRVVGIKKLTWSKRSQSFPATKDFLYISTNIDFGLKGAEKMLLANRRSDIVETVSRTVSRHKKSIKISQSDVIHGFSGISTFPGCILFFEKNSVICELLCAYRLLCEKKQGVKHE